jgi:hypothetical protein
MAIVQISQIKHRHGLQNDLPQLATAELGWSVDTRKLYIGNGTLGEGAPEIGNTEILTEYSNLSNYTVYSVAVSDGSTANLNYAIADANKPAIYVQYAAVRDEDSRVGWIKLARNLSNNTYYYDEEYTESANIGMKWDIETVGTSEPGAYAIIAANLIASTGFNANIQYTVSTLSF